MPRFAANLSMLFNEVPFLQRFERAAAAGFDAVEFLFPYEHPAAQLRELLDKHRLQLVLHNLPPGDWAAGERGMACLPGREGEFQASVAQGIEYAKVLGVPQLHCLAGRVPLEQRREVHRETLVKNFRFAAEELHKAVLKLLLEPINFYDIPGFYVNTPAQGISILDEVGAGNAFLQYDIYHAQRMQGEIAATMQQLLPRIAHMQLADNPGRNEPGSGELNWAFLFAHIDAIGYRGHVGCEYKPATTTEAGLGWRDKFARPL
jgi:hydroxypyruvate isomerase